MTIAADRLSTTLAALADPTRRAISKHLKVLERAGLIARGREAQRRPCRLAPAPLREVSDWVATYRQFWEQRLDRLEDYLAQAQAAGRARTGKGKSHGRKRK